MAGSWQIDAIGIYIPEKGGNESQQPPDERVICYMAKGSGEGCGAGPRGGSGEGSRAGSKADKAPEEGLGSEETVSVALLAVGDFPWAYATDPPKI